MQIQGAKACRMSLALVVATSNFAVQAEAQSGNGMADGDFPTGIFDPADPRNPELETLIWNALAESGAALTSIESVACSDTECEIVFTGSDSWPDLLNDLDRVNSDGKSASFFKMWSLGRREVSPGAEVRVLNMSSTCPSSNGCERPEGAVQLASPEGQEALRTRMTTLQNLYHQYEKGLMDQEVFDTHRHSAAALMQVQFVVEWWTTNRHRFSASYQAFIDSALEGGVHE